MAKGRDDTEEYGPPKGHKIVEILNYMPDLRYRGKSDIKHLVIWTFDEYVVHITNAGIPIPHILGPILGLTAEEARKRAPRVKAHMEVNKQHNNITTVTYQETRGQEMLAVNATGLDYILWDYIGPQVPRERREDFALRYGAMLDKILTRLKNLAGRPIKRPKAGSRDYSELLLPGPSAPPPKPAAPATGPLLVQAPTAKTAPLPALLNAAGDPRPIPAVETAPSAGSSAAVARNAPGTAPARAKSSAAPAKNVPAGRNVLRVHPRVGSAKPEPADPEPADPEPAKPEPANPEPSNPERQTGPAATEPEPNPQVSDAVSSSPPKPKRRRLKKVGAARASKPSEALPGSEGSPEHPPGKDANLSGSDGSDDVANLDGILGDGSDDLADLDCILSEDGGIRFEELTDREDEPVDENEGININLTARENEPVAENEGPIPDADARVAAFRPPRKLRSKPSGKKGASFPHHSASLKAQLPPVAVPPRAANPAVKLHSAVGAVENVIGDEPRSFSSEPPALDPLPANSATPNHANRGAGAGNMTGGGAAEGHVAARGKENSPPGGKEGPLKSASRSEKKRSMGTQTSPSDAGQGAQTNQVGVITAEPIVTETGGTGEGIHTAGMPRILSFERGYQGGVLGERGGTYSTAGDGRVPSLSDSIAPRRGAPASVSAGRALTSADLDCCCTDGCGGAVAEVSGGAAAVTDAVSGGVSGVVHGGVSAAATGRGTSAAGTKRKREDKTAEEGRGKMEGKLDFCAACSKIDEADFRAYVQKKNRARDLSLRLLEIIVGQQPEHERLAFLQGLCNKYGGCSNLVRVAPPQVPW